MKLYKLFYCFRWLVSQGKMDRAIGILKKFEKINGKDIDPKIFQDYQVNV